MHIVLFFTFDISLLDWEKSGLLSREVLFYKALSENSDLKFTFITYGNEKDLVIPNLPKNISIMPIYSHIKYSNNKISRILKTFIIPFKFNKIFREADIFKTNQLSGSWLAVLSKLIYRKKLIVRTGYDLYEFSKKQKKSRLKIFVIYLLTQLSITSSDLYSVTSTEDKTLLAKNFKGTKNILVRPNWVELLDNRMQTKRFDNRLLSVGRIEKQKNYSYLVNALKNTDFILDIVGDGSLKKEISILAKSLGVKVNFLGTVSNSELLEVYKKYNFFVSSSLYEGNPKAVLEAMSASCIVILNKSPNVEEIIVDEKNGLLFDINKDNFLDVLNKSIKNKELNKIISANARNTIKNNNSLEIAVDLEKKDYSMLTNK